MIVHLHLIITQRDHVFTVAYTIFHHNILQKVAAYPPSSKIMDKTTIDKLLDYIKRNHYKCESIRGLEQTISQRESTNPSFRFLSDPHSEGERFV